MKKFLLLLICIIFSLPIYSQKKKVKQIHSQQSYVLSPEYNLSGGSSISYIPIQLPQNTIHWTYSITTSDNSRTSPIMNLFTQVANYYSYGTYSIAQSMLTIPASATTCNVWLMDGNNINAFMNGTRFSYYPQGSRKNFRGGAVKNTSPLQGTYYLGLSNPHSFTKIWVHVEIVATIKKPRKKNNVEKILDILSQ